jgi:hypothetical protein
MRKALLDQDNRVIDLQDPTGDNVTWPDAGPTVSIGCFYVPADGSYLPPPAPPAMPEPVPQTISRFQARQLLYQMGLLDDAEALVVAQGVEAAMAWEDVYEFRRDSQLVNDVAPDLGMDQNDLDDFFRIAATITA